MAEPTTREELLEMVRAERTVLETLLAGLRQEQLLQPGVEHGWSVKDILVHMIAWEQRMSSWLEEAMRGEVPQRPGPGLTWDDLDRLNQQIYLEGRDKPLPEVLTEFATTYQRALAVIATVPEKELFDPDHFDWRNGDPLWYMVGGNTFWHYREHADAIRAWLEQSE